ncbi:MAG TPA: hypothetical protein DEP45_09540 [Armatimonadetes bacterium]|nr:hypothetical protein [Armatimonadota bacterium]
MLKKRIFAGHQEGLLLPTPLAAEAKVAPERRLRGRQLPCQPVVCRCGLPIMGEQDQLFELRSPLLTTNH